MDCVYISATYVSSLVVATDSDGNPTEFGGVAKSDMGKVTVHDDSEAEKHIEAGYALLYTPDLEEKANAQSDAEKQSAMEKEKADQEKDAADKETKAVEGIKASQQTDDTEAVDGDDTDGET